MTTQTTAQTYTYDDGTPWEADKRPCTFEYHGEPDRPVAGDRAPPPAAGGGGDPGAPLGGVHSLEVRPCDRLAAPGGCRRDGRPADRSRGAIRGENGLIGCTIGCTARPLPDRALGMCDILDSSLAAVQEMLPTSVGAVSS